MRIYHVGWIRIKQYWRQVAVLYEEDVYMLPAVIFSERLCFIEWVNH
jgi:hypothetical protein